MFKMADMEIQVINIYAFYKQDFFFLNSAECDCHQSASHSKNRKGIANEIILSIQHCIEILKRVLY